MVLEQKSMTLGDLNLLKKILHLFSHTLNYPIKSKRQFFDKLNSTSEKKFPLGYPPQLVIEWISEEHRILQTLTSYEKKHLAEFLLSNTLYLEAFFQAVEAKIQKDSLLVSTVPSTPPEKIFSLFRFTH